jgi:hypothetical protein
VDVDDVAGGRGLGLLVSGQAGIRQIAAGLPDFS